MNKLLLSMTPSVNLQNLQRCVKFVAALAHVQYVASSVVADVRLALASTDKFAKVIIIPSR